MKPSIKTLEKQLDSKEKEVLKLRSDIKKLKDADKPKDITELVGSFEDACKLKKVKPASVYNTKTDTIDEIAYKRIKFTNAVLNEGHKFSMKPDESRYYVWFNISSGFVFLTTDYAAASADTSSASRLCLKTDRLARHSAKILINEYKDFIM